MSCVSPSAMRALTETLNHGEASGFGVKYISHQSQNDIIVTSKDNNHVDQTTYPAMVRIGSITIERSQ